LNQAFRWAVPALGAAILTGCASAANVNAAAAPQPQAGPHLVTLEWLTPPASAAAPSPERSCLARKTETPPVMDGLLDDACWKSAPELTGLTMLDADGTPAEVQTRAQFAFTPDTLYVAFTCAEPAMSGLVAKCAANDSQAIWYDDCVELWLDVNCDRRHACHFLVNSLGAVCAVREWDNSAEDLSADHAGPKKVIHGEEAMRDSGCLTKAARGNDAWTIELAIPARALGTQSILRGSAYGLNVARTRRSGGGCWLSSWTGVFTGPISRFGTLRMDKADLEIDVISQGALSEGESAFAVQVRNASTTTRRIRLEARATSKSQMNGNARISLAPGESKRVSLPYRLQRTGSPYTIELDAFDEVANAPLLSRRYEGVVPEALNLKLTRSELYLGEKKDVEGFLAVNLGDAGLQNGSLSFEVTDAQGRTVAADAAEHLQTRAAVRCRVAELKEEGTYTLRVKLLDRDKHCLAQKQAAFSLAEPPF